MQFNFSDTLTEVDVKRHIPHSFTMPAGATHLRVHLHFDPAAVGEFNNMVTLTIFDPAGFRGAGHRHGNDHVVEIDSARATVGYNAGSLPPGEWIVQMDTHMILPGEPFRYELSISVEQGKIKQSTRPTVQSVPRFETIANPSSGWYRGDLHAHTIHSDAGWDVPDLVAAAKAQKLDFITLTDHNTVSPLAEMAGYSTANFLTMGGQELTTFWGHAVCLGRHEWIDWRVTRASNEMADIASQLYADGQIFIIAHPKDIGDPYCTGCRWVYPNMMPGTARFVEVWNGSWFGDHELNRDKNVDGLALWYQWLNQGLRLVATAGSDVHRPAGYACSPGFNTIFAEELSEKGILRGLAAGHSYLSSGPQLTFTAQDAKGIQVMMGDTLAVDESTTKVALQASWGDAPTGATLRLIADGTVREEVTVDKSGTIDWQLPAQEVSWSLVELRDANDQMLALTNPMYF